MAVEILSRECVYDGYMKVETLQVRLADGTQAPRVMESHGQSMSVLPYDPERRVALVVRLFRHPVFDVTGEPLLEECCAGMIEEGQSPEDTARREAEEELGYRLRDLEAVGHTWSSPGISTERQSLFLAPYSRADHDGRGGGAPGEHEGITVVERPLAELAADALAGRITDSKLLILVLSLQARRPELFA